MHSPSAFENNSSSDRDNRQYNITGDHSAIPTIISSSRATAFCFASCIASYIIVGVVAVLLLFATLFKTHTDRTLYEYSYAAALSNLPASDGANTDASRRNSARRPAVGSPDDLATNLQRHRLATGEITRQYIEQRAPKAKNASAGLSARRTSEQRHERGTDNEQVAVPASWFDPPLQQSVSSNFFLKPSVRCVALPHNVNYIYIAANLHNSEHVLPVWMREMKRFLLMLTGCDLTAQQQQSDEDDRHYDNSGIDDGETKRGRKRRRRERRQQRRGDTGPPRRSRVFVSVFTNACADRTNEILLVNFGAWLRRHNIPHILNVNALVDGKYSSRPPSMQRIHWLSQVRNAALAPLVTNGTRLFVTEAEDKDALDDDDAVAGVEQQLQHPATLTPLEVLKREQQRIVVLGGKDDHGDDFAVNRNHQSHQQSEDAEFLLRQGGAVLAQLTIDSIREAEIWQSARGAHNNNSRSIDKLLASRFSSFHNNNNLPSLSDVRVLFINDIIFSAEDLLLLLHTNGGAFDMACGMDYYFNFYDTWVARDVSGRPFWAAPPYSPETALSQGVQQLNPVKVGCCWNGAVVARARVFVAEGVDADRLNIATRRFWMLYQQQRQQHQRQNQSLVELQKQHKQISRVIDSSLRQIFFKFSPNIVFRWSCVRCCLSECSLLCRDLRRPEFGSFGEIVMNPLVRVGYEPPGYLSHRGTLTVSSLLVDFFEATAWIWAGFNTNFLFVTEMGFANATEGALEFQKMGDAVARAAAHLQRSAVVGIVGITRAERLHEREQDRHHDNELWQKQRKRSRRSSDVSDEKISMTVDENGVPATFYAPLDDQYEACFSSGQDSASVTVFVGIEAATVAAAGLLFLFMFASITLRYVFWRRAPVFLSWRFVQMLRCKSVSRVSNSFASLFPCAPVVSSSGSDVLSKLVWLVYCCCWCSEQPGGVGSSSSAGGSFLPSSPTAATRSAASPYYSSARDDDDLKTV